MCSSIIKLNFTIQDYYDKGLIKSEDVQLIKEYLKNENLPYDSDELIGIFLRSCNNNLEDTKMYAKANYAGRKAIPEIFSNRDLQNKKLQKTWGVVEMSVMPTRTVEGYAVVIFRLSDPTVSNFQMDLIVKLFLMILDSVFYNEPVTGFVVVIDLKKMSLRHLTKLNFSVLKRLLKYASEGLLCLLKNVHYINGGYILDQLFKIFKVLCKPELLELFRYYQRDMDWDDFYENSVCKKCLPLDYGGELEPMGDLHEKMWRKLLDLQEYFEQEIKHRQAYEEEGKN